MEKGNRKQRRAALSQIKKIIRKDLKSKVKNKKNG